MDIQQLRKSLLFEKLSSAELEAVASIAKEKDVIAGDYVFSEGAPSSSLFVVRHGTIEIFKKGNEKGEEQAVTQMAAGSSFGDMGFTDREPRAGSAMAKENCKLVEIPYDALESLIASRPDIGLKIFRSLATVLCRRIRQTTNNLTSLKELKLRNL